MIRSLESGKTLDLRLMIMKGWGVDPQMRIIIGLMLPQLRKYRCRHGDVRDTRGG